MVTDGETRIRFVIKMCPGNFLKTPFYEHYVFKMFMETFFSHNGGHKKHKLSCTSEYFFILIVESGAEETVGRLQAPCSAPF